MSGTNTQDALAKTLATELEFTYNVFKQNTAGVDHELSLKRPQPAGNSIHWIGAHVVATRCGLLEMLGGESPWSPERRAQYRRGASPPPDAEAPAWTEVLKGLDVTQERLRAAFAALTPERLLAALPEDKNPFRVDNLAEMIGTFAFHEAYHVGQLGLARRLVGLEGAIS